MLLGFARQSRVHDQRIEADETPARGLEAPAVFAEDRAERLPVLFRRRLWRRRADRRRIIADVMIAGQIAATDGQGAVQRVGKFEIVAIGRCVEGEVAAVDDKIGARRIDVVADTMKIIGQRLETAGEVGVGNLGQAIFGHATFLPARLYLRRKSEW